MAFDSGALRFLGGLGGGPTPSGPMGGGGTPKGISGAGPGVRPRMGVQDPIRAAQRARFQGGDQGTAPEPQPYAGRGLNFTLLGDLMSFIRQHPAVLTVAGFIGAAATWAWWQTATETEQLALVQGIRDGIPPQELHRKLGKGEDFNSWLKGTFAGAKALVEEESQAAVTPQSFATPSGGVPTGPPSAGGLGGLGGPGAPGAPGAQAGGFQVPSGAGTNAGTGIGDVGARPLTPRGPTGTPFPGLPAGGTPATEETTAGLRSNYRDLGRALNFALESIGVTPGMGDWSRWMAQWTAPEAISALTRDVPSGVGRGGQPGLEAALQARARGGPITSSRVQMMKALQDTERFVRENKAGGMSVADIIAAASASGTADSERVGYVAKLIDREYENADDIGELLAMVAAGDTEGRQGTNPGAIPGLAKIYGGLVRRAIGSLEKPPNESTFKFFRGLVLSPAEMAQLDSMGGTERNPEGWR